MDSTIAEKNIPYYNEIAGDYDTILDAESTNNLIRMRVKDKFTYVVKGGRVLDFGGGTGRDLEWLTSRYQVLFCEPSAGMRRIAFERYGEADEITFLDSIDFTNWQNSPPFEGKVDAILSNFTVINCIADIDNLFATLASLIKPGGHFIALMLQHGYKKNPVWKMKEFIKGGETPVLNIKYKKHEQTVFVYSPRAIKKASSKWFYLQSGENLYEFTLFHFIKRCT